MTIKEQVIETINTFLADQLGIHPESVTVDLHPDCIVATLHNAISLAETNYAKEASSCSLLTDFYKDLFEQSKGQLEIQLDKYITATIDNSGMTLHPQSGRIVIVISLGREKQTL